MGDQVARAQERDEPDAFEPSWAEHACEHDRPFGGEAEPFVREAEARLYGEPEASGSDALRLGRAPALVPDPDARGLGHEVLESAKRGPPSPPRSRCSRSSRLSEAARR